MLFKTRWITCSTSIHAFVLIPFVEYDVVFPSIFVNSFTLVFKEGGSSFATQCFAFCSVFFSFRSRVCSSDSPLLYGCMKKTCSSSATSEEDVVTSKGTVWISSRSVRRIFSVTLNSGLERNSAAVSTEPAMCAILNLNCCRNCLSLEKTCDRFVICRNNLWLLLPTEYAQTREMPCKLPTILLKFWTL